ncbi:hypothetical protein PR202_gb00688 [Eleusine coracana subsp. coracana]|uniref:Galacturonosyltransferase 7 n=1 Tax=Eleusine coracana subsp. coracana TaxID=191504 RepID=A0AAV5DVH4_ELECO|nr:hypothetical protein PR202_gb00688 [Eleusine coracana subsp. coracana]
MKGHHYQQQHSSPPKRRCSGLAAAVPALVVCSILLPLVFLLASTVPVPTPPHPMDLCPFQFHACFSAYSALPCSAPAGYGSEERAAVVISTELDFGARKHRDGSTMSMKHKLLKDVSKKKTYGISRISTERSTRSKSKNLSFQSKAKVKGAFSLTDLKDGTFSNNGPHTLKRYQLKDLSLRSKEDTTSNGEENHDQEIENEENPKSCELEYGSYCLWSVEHKEVIKDAIVKRLKDQLFMVRAHYPSIAKLKHQETFTLASNHFSFAKKLDKMEHAIERAKSCEVGCSNVERKLRQLLDITEDEAYFHTRQSAFLYHLGIQTMPKTHHCFNMRLTVEYFKSTSIHMDRLNKQKLESPTFQRYVISSRNLLTASTTINSTVTNSKDSSSTVFHVFTDVQNFYAMKHWFD